MHTPFRRLFPQELRWRLAWPLAILLGIMVVLASSGRAGANDPVIRDRLWAWAHEAGVYNGNWALAGPSRITPVEGAAFLDIPNVIFIRYEGKPAPPFDQYFVPFRSLRRVFWSITGASGATSAAEREHVFRLAAAQTNVVGVFMDDFFNLTGEEKGPPQWLAENQPTFPVLLSLHLADAVEATRVEIRQTDWRTGDYRTKEVAVDGSADGVDWREAARVQLPNEPGVAAALALDGRLIRHLRFRILSTHDRNSAQAMSCGLQRVRLWEGAKEVALAEAKVEASSIFPGHAPENVLPVGAGGLPSAPAALSLGELQEIRRRLTLPDRRLQLGVTLYTYQLTPQVRAHLDLCDVVSLWTWKAEDLRELEPNFAKLRSLIGPKPVLLGCYMYDFGNNRPMPLDLMQHQCGLALRWLQEGSIDGIIFLATNVCDLNLETVEWTRAWVARVGNLPLRR